MDVKLKKRYCEIHLLPPPSYPILALNPVSLTVIPGDKITHAGIRKHKITFDH
jgi:adenine deaminase